MGAKRTTAPIMVTVYLLVSPSCPWIAATAAQQPNVDSLPFDFAEASRDVPKPREVYPYVKRDMIPMDLKIVSDEMVASDTDPSKQLRRITDLSHEYRDGRNYYRAKVESVAKVQLVRTWFVYAHNPQWRDLVWFEWLMQKHGEYYETSVPGCKVDAYMIKVADTAM